MKTASRRASSPARPTCNHIWSRARVRSRKTSLTNDETNAVTRANWITIQGARCRKCSPSHQVQSNGTHGYAIKTADTLGWKARFPTYCRTSKYRRSLCAGGTSMRGELRAGAEKLGGIRTLGGINFPLHRRTRLDGQSSRFLLPLASSACLYLGLMRNVFSSVFVMFRNVNKADPFRVVWRIRFEEHRSTGTTSCTARPRVPLFASGCKPRRFA